MLGLRGIRRHVPWRLTYSWPCMCSKSRTATGGRGPTSAAGNSNSERTTGSRSTSTGSNWIESIS